MSTLGVHPNGIASQTDQFWVNFDPVADLSKVAEAAGGAYAQIIERPEELRGSLVKAIEIVKSGRSAVLDVRLQNVSQQQL